MSALGTERRGTMKLRQFKSIVGTQEFRPGLITEVYGPPQLQQWFAIFRNGKETPDGEWVDVPEVWAPRKTD